MQDKTQQFTRRDLLKRAAYGTAAAGMGQLFSGCSGGGNSSPLNLPAGVLPNRSNIRAELRPVVGPARSTIVPYNKIQNQEAYYLSSNKYTFLITGKETGGRFCAFDFYLPPGGGPAPHLHSTESETFFTISGQVDETVDHHPTHVTAGGILYGAQGRSHAFKNNYDADAHLLSITVPSGLEVLFQNAGKRVTDYFAPIPRETEEQLQHTVEVSLQRGDRPFRDEDTPPSSPYLLDRVLTEAPGMQVDPALAGTPGARAYMREQRPAYAGPFGFTGTWLVESKDSNGTLLYSYFDLEPQTSYPDPLTSPYDEVIYVLDGQLQIKINGQETIAPPLTFIYVAPGDSYTVTNLSGQPAHGLAVSIRPGSNSLYPGSSNRVPGQTS